MMRLRRKRSIHDARSRELNSTQKAELRDFAANNMVWRFLMEHWEARFQVLSEQLAKATNIDEMLRLQGRVQELERVLRTPEHYLDDEE